MDIVDFLRGCFLIAACTILSVNAVPSLRTRFATYGPRATTSTSRNVQPEKQTALKQCEKSRVSLIGQFLDTLASWRVPHSFFTHFYAMSVICSILWAMQLSLKGQLFRAVACMVSDANVEKSMSLEQVILCWALMAFQGARRLCESITQTGPSESNMWFVHWILGLAYYIAMSVAIWVEGISAIQSPSYSFADARPPVPSPRTTIFLPVFLIASGIQYDCHRYLASLKKYTLPAHPAFLSVVCPHYLAECTIYLSLVFLAAPKDEIVNKTLLAGLCFVVVNLGVSASITKQWYMQKFGEEKVQHRWKMIPLLY